MSNPDPLPQDDAPDPAILRAEGRLLMLRELAEIGMELARVLLRGASEALARDEASDDETAALKSRATPCDPADAFGRISRAVRLTLTLEAKTDEALRFLKAGVTRQGEVARAEAQAYADRVAKATRQAREELIPDFVLTIADAEIPDVQDLANLAAALHEHLTKDSAYTDFPERPLRETLERLCKDLKLNPDWSRWDDANGGWIDDGPPVRSARHAIFNQPSAHPLFEDGPWNAPPPPPPGMRHPPHLE